MEDRLPLLRSSPSFYQFFLSLGSTKGCSTTTLCASGEAFFEKLKPVWNLLRPVSRCLDTRENAIGRPIRDQGLRHVFGPGLMVLGHLGFAIGRQTPSRRHRVPQKWHMVQRLAPCNCPSSMNDGDSPFSNHESSPFLHTINPESTPGESSINIIATKTSKSLTYNVATSIDFALPLAVVMTVGSFGFLRISSSTKVRLSLTHYVKRCAAVHHEFLIFVMTIQPRCDNFLWSCSVRRPEENFTCLNTSPLDFVNVLEQIPCYLANKFHVCFNKICTTSELRVRQSIRTSTVLSTSLNYSKE